MLDDVNMKKEDYEDKTLELLDEIGEWIRKKRIELSKSKGGNKNG